MPKIQYIEKRFQHKSRQIIDKANEIIAEYAAEGFDLTLRQLYYQFVARDILPNSEKSYDSLGAIISDARLAGEIDWDTIKDRLREINALSHFDDPADIVRNAARWYTVARWKGQKNRVEVWIEKDALLGTIQNVCTQFDVPYFACRGYASQTSMWEAAQRLRGYYEEHDQQPVIIHLGDHDPSGIDMTRDIVERMQLFLRADCGIEADVERVALNMDQVRHYNPPPNPAKLSDYRAEDYIKKFGSQSWELDALSPRTIEALIRKHIVANIDDAAAWDRQTKYQKRGRLEIEKAAGDWRRIAKSLRIKAEELESDEDEIEEEDEIDDADTDPADDELDEDEDDEDDD